MKTKCRECNQEKENYELVKNKNGQNGVENWCNKCKQKYNKKYATKNKTKIAEYYEKYSKEHPRVEYLKKWRKENQVKSNKKMALLYPEKIKARRAVLSAVRSGRLRPVKELVCAYCKINQAVAYHHYKGYATENVLNVIPLCRNCHKS